MQVYHRHVFFPSWVQSILPTGEHRLYYGPHARNAAVTDELAEQIILPQYVNFRSHGWQKVATRNSKFHSGLYRMEYDGDIDLCLAVLRKMFVCTVWLMLCTDHLVNKNTSRVYSENNTRWLVETK